MKFREFLGTLFVIACFAFVAILLCLVAAQN